MMKKKFIGCIMFGLLMCIAPTTVFAGAWAKNDDLGQWQYIKDNGSYAANEWIYDNGAWYFFGLNRLMKENTFTMPEQDNSGGEYYLDSSGKMASGGFITRPNDPSDRYFLDKDGHVVKGLFMIDGVLYETRSDGGLIPNITYNIDMVIYNEDLSKYAASANSNKYKDLYCINAIYDHGKILDKDGKPFAADSKIFTQAKYIPKYDSQGNLIGAIQNPNGYVIK